MTTPNDRRDLHADLLTRAAARDPGDGCDTAGNLLGWLTTVLVHYTIPHLRGAGFAVGTLQSAKLVSWLLPLALACRLLTDRLSTARARELLAACAAHIIVSEPVDCWPRLGVADAAVPSEILDEVAAYARTGRWAGQTGAATAVRLLVMARLKHDDAVLLMLADEVADLEDLVLLCMTRRSQVLDAVAYARRQYTVLTQEVVVELLQAAGREVPPRQAE